MLKDARLMSEQRGAGSPCPLAHYKSLIPQSLHLPSAQDTGTWEFHLSYDLLRSWPNNSTPNNLFFGTLLPRGQSVFTIAHLSAT